MSTRIYPEFCDNITNQTEPNGVAGGFADFYEEITVFLGWKFYAHFKEDIYSRFSDIKDQFTASDTSSDSYIKEDNREAIVSLKWFLWH